jgi:hypothetical protein
MTEAGLDALEMNAKTSSQGLNSRCMKMTESIVLVTVGEMVKKFDRFFV